MPLTLEFRQRGEYPEHQPAAGGRGVDVGSLAWLDCQSDRREWRRGGREAQEGREVTISRSPAARVATREADAPTRAKPLSAVMKTGAGFSKRLNLIAVRATLESAGVIFVEENGEGPGVRLSKGDVAPPPRRAAKK
jgi:hypothetical protein